MHEPAEGQACDVCRLRIEIAGAVQGVGFRPFVYRLATALALSGWVINDARGVFIEVEGGADPLATFLARLAEEAPPNARITRITHAWLPAAGYTRFEIRHSDSAGVRRVIVLPDLATCTACCAELFTPTDRRYRYPFINCTNCGPRFTIVEALPYDRPNTTMRDFVLCPACQTEYRDPLDRRFHAQPNACAVCGPQVAFYAQAANPQRVALQSPSSTARWPQTRGSLTLRSVEDAAVRAAVAAIRHGAIVAVKGMGGFHLMADARRVDAVQTLRTRKARPDKPLAVMVRNLDQAATLCDVTPVAADLLTSPAAPIVLLPRRGAARIADNVAPGNPDLGIMLPATPLHHLLLAELDIPIVATSGNLTDEPICTDEWEACARLGEIADSFLLHDRPIARHADDSVLWLVDGAPQFLRRARGYAPLPVTVPRPLPTILAVGAHLKNTVALSIEEQVFLSQHIGDLETTPALDAFHRVIADFLRLYATAPGAIAHDLHPEYLSTKWAKNQPAGTHLIPVQHHHAHLAACLADNAATGPALGLIWDGTGYGADGIIWGGECLLGDAAACTRVAHLRPFRLPGGDAAVRAPGRVALALLWELYGDAALTWEWLAPVRSFPAQDRQLLCAMLARAINAPLTTSMGRLFDGVAALISLRQTSTFEGQAAMLLEHCAAPHESATYTFEVHAGQAGAPAVIDWAPVVEAILADLRRNTEAAVIAARFHNALVAMGVAVARSVGQVQVALSGGCFQNRRLTEQLARELRASHFAVLLHRQVPPNDGGVSLGQIMVAAAAGGSPTPRTAFV